MRARHRDYYMSMAARLDTPAQTGHEQRIEQAEIEIDNLRAAFAWSRENADIELALTLACSLQPLWLARGRIQEGLTWFDAVLSGVVAEQPEVSPTVRARALADKAVLDSWVGIHGTGDAEQALAVARELDDPALLARALIACGSAAAFNAEVAGPYLAEAIGLARALGDRWRVCQILGRQANAAFIAGDPIAVRAAAEEGRDLADAIGDRFESRQCRWRLGGAQVMQGDLTAIAQLRELLAEAEADHDVMLRVTLLFILGHAHSYQGDTIAARAAADAAIEAAAELGEYYVGSGYTALTVVALAAGDVALAADASEAAWSHISGYRETAADYTAFIAPAALARGHLTAARRWADDASAATTGWYRAAALTTLPASRSRRVSRNRPNATRMTRLRAPPASRPT